MPRPRNDPTTALGAAVVDARADRSLQALAKELRTTHITLSRVERGTHKPSIDTSYKLARWLGWDLERVIRAANQPALMHRPLALEEARRYAPDDAELGREWYRGRSWVFELGELLVTVHADGLVTKMPVDAGTLRMVASVDF